MLGRSNRQEGSMLKPILFITVASALVVVSAPGARADMCFRYTKSGGLSVAQADLPDRNDCITFALYEPSGSGGLMGAGTGSLCTSIGGTFVVFHYTYHNCVARGPSSPFKIDGDSYFESATCQVRLNTSGGGTVGTLPTTTPSVCRGIVAGGKPGQAGKVGAFFNYDDLKIEKCDSNDFNFAVPSGDAVACYFGTEYLRQSPDQPSPKLPSQGSDQPRQSPEQR
jgi:hypothetical protein